jgi:CheY-like chemotaxis protein
MVATRFSDLEILVVDDEEFSRTIAVRILRMLAVRTVRHAVNGFEGLQRLRYPHRADVVVLDINMPLMNGLEMLRKIRDGSAGVDRDLTVMILTGHSDHAFVSTAQALDVNAFLVKPVAPSTFAARLDAVLAEGIDLKSASVYGEVPIPRTIRLSSTGLLSRMREYAWDCAQPVRLSLENIPVNARLVDEVMGPDGDLLLPAGVCLTPRLLGLLGNLRALDDCVAQLTVELAAEAN